MNKDKQVLKLEGVTYWQRGSGSGVQRMFLKVEKKERVLIYGTSGSGAKELYRVLSGQQKPVEGQLVTAGRLAVLPEQFPDFPHMTGKDYLLLPALLKKKKKHKAWKKIRGQVSSHWVWNLRSTCAASLSGFQQGILLAWMAFLQSPDVVLVGNCMQRMSSGEEKQFWEELNLLYQEGHAALLCISDSIPEFFSFDTVYCIAGGELTVERR